MREFTVAPAVEVRPEQNLCDAVWDNAQQYPGDVVFSRQVDAAWQTVTTTQFRDQVASVAAGLIGSGINPGDRVGLMSATRYEWTLFDYAIWAAGAVTVPIYETSSAEQVAWILQDSGATAAVLETPAHLATLATVRNVLPELQQVWVIDDDAIDAVGAVAAVVGAADEAAAQQVQQRRHCQGRDDLATIVYTSGTTGRPKGCRLTHGNFLAAARNSEPGFDRYFSEGADASSLLFLPLAHVLGRFIQVMAVLRRARIGHTSDTSNLVADLGAFNPTFLLSVPRVFEKIYNGAQQKAAAAGKGGAFDRATQTAIAYSKALDAGGPSLGLRARHMVFDRLVYRQIRAALGGRMESSISGGAPLGERLGHFFRGIGLTIYEGYGLTETTAPASSNTWQDIRIGTVGRPLPGVSARIASDGELILRGPNVFDGYWNNPEATAQVLQDGWFATGDLAAIDDEGYLRITGRKKEIIVTAGGKNVAPAVLEDRIRANPLVAECIVVGDQRPFIAALVTIDPDSLPTFKAANGKPESATMAELAEDADLRAAVQTAIDDANAAVSRAESIRAFTVLDNEFTEASGELTPSLKLKRGVVLDRYEEQIAALYAPGTRKPASAAAQPG